MAYKWWHDPETFPQPLASAYTDKYAHPCHTKLMEMKAVRHVDTVYPELTLVQARR
jgi:hypothetical protein